MVSDEQHREASPMAKLLRLSLAILTFLVFFLLDDPANEISTRWIGCQWVLTRDARSLPDPPQYCVKSPISVSQRTCYYRAHFREAVQKDGVVCLECGAIFKYLPGHLCKHNLSSHEYRAKWGYNRRTPLERLSTRRKKRRNALAKNFGALTPSNAHQKPPRLAEVMVCPIVQRGGLLIPRLLGRGLLRFSTDGAKGTESCRNL
jgi:ROS/MUCR transcriptional regulator protein